MLDITRRTSFMLSGAQLGITACTFLLGAITKPAIDYALTPVLTGWGIPGVVSGIVAFVLALIVVTFLHLVIGEMAQKSWAIAHPETAAKATGIAARALTWPLRHFLLWINRIVNRLVAASGVEPVEKAAAGGQDVDTIRTERPPASVPRTATIAEVQRTSVATGHLRILLGEGPDCGVVHVRDTLLAAPESPALDVSRPAFALRPDTPAHEALAQMRRNREQFAIVVDDGSLLGVVTLQDLLVRVLPTDVQG